MRYYMEQSGEIFDIGVVAAELDADVLFEFNTRFIESLMYLSAVTGRQNVNGFCN